MTKNVRKLLARWLSYELDSFSSPSEKYRLSFGSSKNLAMQLSIRRPPSQLKGLHRDFPGVKVKK